MLWRSLKRFDQHNSFCSLRSVYTRHHGDKICVPKQWNGDRVPILNEWHWGFYQNTASLVCNQRLGSLAYNYKSAVTIRTYFHVIIDISRKMWSRVVPAKIYLKTRAMISFYIVSRGNWLWKVANIKKKRKKKPMVLQFVLEAPRRCTIHQNVRNATERCAPSNPQKHVKKTSDGLYDHSTLLVSKTTLEWLY